MRRRFRPCPSAMALTLALTAGVLFAAPASLLAQGDLSVQYQEVVRRPIPRGPLDRTFDFSRTELYFGTAKPDGVVSDEEFHEFLDREITPRFPAGLTLLKGDGQFLGENGFIVTEVSYLLILLYPEDSFKRNNTRINTIRRLYKEEFQQESVLRVDDPGAVRVSF